MIKAVIYDKGEEKYTVMRLLQGKQIKDCYANKKCPNEVLEWINKSGSNAYERPTYILWTKEF